ncbi:MAG: hypothetical protein JO366_13225 [Methylobacteriaceae bacterium]|nr:hypothetical protein [Methylobacteriaceae bacterium]
MQVCLPGVVKTEFHTSQGIDPSVFPARMTADDVVTASLTGLMRDEIVCVPALADAALFDKVCDAQTAVFKAAAYQSSRAERYRSQEKPS